MTEPINRDSTAAARGRDTGISEFAKSVIRKLFASRHESTLAHDLARGSIRDAQWWLRNIGRSK